MVNESRRVEKMQMIVCKNNKGVIGVNNQLPWKHSLDMKIFKTLTQNHTIVMGRKTWESLGGPLMNRKHIILSKDPSFCVPHMRTQNHFNDIPNDAFIIGGMEIFREAHKRNLIKTAFISTVDNDIDGDTFFDIDLSKYHYRETIDFLGQGLTLEIIYIMHDILIGDQYRSKILRAYSGQIEFNNSMIKEFYKNYDKHNESGPARIIANTHKEYWFEGIRYLEITSDLEWLMKVEELKNSS